ncbi:MAG: succinyl-diaminopimelate desuccinylase [Sphingomonadales bacterium 35-56-22]|jgi:succinyl-diaminopimelate desuccinylase|uniref:succinyl-diaminopimelate desuccinylase n=1 Tax=Sphingorhabdus sp. TaxID=1902408 RepID=UPI000BD55511|nr:succinyl-diaminopimelate desuccinylase [Sphingorhabdus sp.]OYY15402.1 MAG: succinyl-diaminopimelate desuccinylase [Sphingomonadales bacterium 35-56-22]OYY97108.1 MAG: succinyl-diaminopimelate desuccinylase [Sphingomonadales bacterium 28-56-43]OYZ60308.1 MAG: succinyl-diaminopimelate desuccinylase [Sphingomonadales bacterium 24-56-14]OZA82900.1 MAG: succinyl-diaminopimelate desuccinylase [Sphingomonadales bacterium 39-57-19]HQS13060.1 succinyl-diaminopimelate desuccinylase [Sphingorhabdus sp
MTDAPALDYAQRLISCESVTPAQGAVFDALEDMLKPLGFRVDRFVSGSGDDNPAHGAPVENLFAIRESGGRHFAFAGHLDVVPPGAGWASDPFVPQIKGDLLHGRGAVDMKGSIAAFVAALHEIPADAGTISLIITGDEEGPAIYGTRALIDHMQALGTIPDACLVGEPTSVNRLGDMMKIGRRGSVNIWISVAGTQGHVAYPHLADNPIPKLVAILSEIEAITLDAGTDWFQPSNIEITDLAVGNKATNVIPAKAEARLSIRFNDLHSGEALVARMQALVEKGGGKLTAMISGEAFLTPPGELSAAISEAVEGVMGITPEPSTTGGTSDARFLTKICPVVEFGLCNATMHKLDEAVAIADLTALTEIYRRVAIRMLGS